MKSSSGHLVFAVLGLALACAFGAFFLLRGSTTGAEGIAGSADEQNPPVASLTANTSSESRPERAVIAPRREAVSSERAATDPEYQAALAGFRGRVVSAESKPAPDKLVKLYRFDPSVVMLPGVTSSGDTLIEPNLDAGEARTGSDGTFTICGVYPGSTYALVADAGGETPTFRILERSPGPGLVVDLGDIPLRTTATVTGTVVDADGKPIAGALVRALDIPGAALAAMPVERFDPEGAVLMRALPDYRSGGNVVFEIPAWVKKRFDELPIPKARSDVDGKFVLRGVDPGVNAFMVTTANLTSFVNPTLRLKAGQTKDVGTIKLEPGETVQGRVIDGNGTAVVGVEILVAQASPAVPADFALRAPKTDEKGRFACAGLKPGMATVAARRSAREPWTITEPTAIGSDLVVKLPKLP